MQELLPYQINARLNTSHLRVVRKLVGISFGRRHVLRILSCPLAPVPVDLELGHSGFGWDYVLKISIATLVEDSVHGLDHLGLVASMFLWSFSQRGGDGGVSLNSGSV